MKAEIQCKNCGRTRQVPNKKPFYITNVIRQGWGSAGVSLYCPTCIKAEKLKNPLFKSDDVLAFVLIADEIVGKENTVSYRYRRNTKICA